MYRLFQLALASGSADEEEEEEDERKVPDRTLHQITEEDGWDLDLASAYLGGLDWQEAPISQCYIGFSSC